MPKPKPEGYQHKRAVDDMDATLIKLKRIIDEATKEFLKLSEVDRRRMMPVLLHINNISQQHAVLRDIQQEMERIIYFSLENPAVPSNEWDHMHQRLPDLEARVAELENVVDHA